MKILVLKDFYIASFIFVIYPNKLPEIMNSASWRSANKFIRLILSSNNPYLKDHHTIYKYKGIL